MSGEITIYSGSEPVLMWQTASDAREWDHPVDRMDLPEHLRSSVYIPQFVPVVYPQQEQHVLEQLHFTNNYGESVMRSLASVAIDCQTDRDKWELANLQAANISPSNMDPYVRFAGHPERISGFINWFAQLTSELPATSHDKGIVDHEGRYRDEELLDNEEDLTDNSKDGSQHDADVEAEERIVNGYTFTVGTAHQMGRYALSRTLDTNVGRGLRELQTMRYGYKLKKFQSGEAPRHHKVELVQIDGEQWQTKEGDLLLHIIRERRAAEIGQIRLIKRFDSLVAVRSIELIRNVMDLLATNNGTLLRHAQGDKLEQFVRHYESTIHWQGRLKGPNKLGIVPISTTYLLRNPKKQPIL